MKLAGTIGCQSREPLSEKRFLVVLLRVTAEQGGSIRRHALTIMSLPAWLGSPAAAVAGAFCDGIFTLFWCCRSLPPEFRALTQDAKISVALKGLTAFHLRICQTDSEAAPRGYVEILSTSPPVASQV
jgi:hypothetical protein